MAKEKSFDEFMSLKEEDQIRFDFSNQTNDIFDNFFIYMAAVSEFSTTEKSELFRIGNLFKLDNSINRIITHPDGSSMLLQDIYKKLWDSNDLNMCKQDKKNLSGETMNSASISLNALYQQHLESSQEKEERKEIGPKQQVSTKYIVSRYAREYFDISSQPNSSHEFLKKLRNVAGLEDFLCAFHTLGNFLPFPNNCNSSRGRGELKDYWDLTLACIYNWYNPKKAISGKKYDIAMISSQEISQLEIWLKNYGSWNNFVDKNFLGDWDDENNVRKNFVIRIQKTENKEYGPPRELWRGHFSGAVIPESTKDFESFFSNAAEWVQNRGRLMVRKLSAI